MKVFEIDRSRNGLGLFPARHENTAHPKTDTRLSAAQSAVPLQVPAAKLILVCRVRPLILNASPPPNFSDVLLGSLGVQRLFPSSENAVDELTTDWALLVAIRTDIPLILGYCWDDGACSVVVINAPLGRLGFFGGGVEGYYCGHRHSCERRPPHGGLRDGASQTAQIFLLSRSIEVIRTIQNCPLPSLRNPNDSG